MDLAGKREGDQDAIVGALAVGSLHGETAWNQKESITGERWAEEKGRRVNENPEVSSSSDHMHMEKHAGNQEVGAHMKHLFAHSTQRIFSGQDGHLNNSCSFKEDRQQVPFSLNTILLIQHIKIYCSLV